MESTTASTWIQSISLVIVEGADYVESTLHVSKCRIMQEQVTPIGILYAHMHLLENTHTS